MSKNPNEASWQSPLLGLGILLSAFALTVIFTSEGSLKFRTGHTAGALASSAALALPIFLAWKYTTRSGRQQRFGVAFNGFVLITIGIWFALFIVAKGVLPNYVLRTQAAGQGQAKGKSASTTITNSPDDNLDKPTYDTLGWTQDNTGSHETGAWLKYDPPGTRYCRNNERSIYRLYPPGVRPNAEPANPFCLGDSSATVPK
jgi:hypothetical protein